MIFFISGSRKLMLNIFKNGAHTCNIGHIVWGSGFNRMIESNLKMLILKRFATKMIVYVMMTTELFIKYCSSIKLCYL